MKLVALPNYLLIKCFFLSVFLCEDERNRHIRNHKEAILNGNVNVLMLWPFSGPTSLFYFTFIYLFMVNLLAGKQM